MLTGGTALPETLSPETPRRIEAASNKAPSGSPDNKRNELVLCQPASAGATEAATRRTREAAAPVICTTKPHMRESAVSGRSILRRTEPVQRVPTTSARDAGSATRRPSAPKSEAVTKPSDIVTGRSDSFTASTSIPQFAEVRRLRSSIPAFAGSKENQADAE